MYDSKRCIRHEMRLLQRNEVAAPLGHNVDYVAGQGTELRPERLPQLQVLCWFTGGNCDERATAQSLARISQALEVRNHVLAVLTLHPSDSRFPPPQHLGSDRGEGVIRRCSRRRVHEHHAGNLVGILHLEPASDSPAHRMSHENERPFPLGSVQQGAKLPRHLTHRMRMWDWATATTLTHAVVGTRLRLSGDQRQHFTPHRGIASWSESWLEHDERCPFTLAAKVHSMFTNAHDRVE